MTAFWLDSPLAPYTFHAFDISIRAVAQLYKTSVEAIWEANRSAPEYVSAQSADDFAELVTEGAFLFVPVPPDEQLLWWDKQAVKGRYSNLQAVCDVANTDPLRHGLEKLYPVDLVLRAVNADLRARLGVSVATLLDLHGAVGEIPLPDDVSVAIPYPPVPIVATIAAAAHLADFPYDTRSASTLRTAPGWVRELYDRHLFPLWMATLDLEAAITRCEKTRKEALEELGVLNVLRWFLDELAGAPERVATLTRELNDLQEVAVRKLGVDPAWLARTYEDSERDRLSKAVTTRLLDARFGELVQQAFLGADHPVIHVDVHGGVLAAPEPRRMSLKGLVADIMNRAVLALAVSGADASFLDVVTRAIDGMGTASRSTLQGITALEKIVSISGANHEVVRDLIGDLKSPRMLALATVTIAAADVLPTLAKDPTVARRAVGDRLTTALVRIADLDAVDAAALSKALANGSPSALTLLASATTAGSELSDGDGLQGAVAFFSTIAVVVALAQGDREPVRLVANLLGTTAYKTAAILDHFKSLAVAEDAIADTVIRRLRVFSGVMGVVSGVYTLIGGVVAGEPRSIVVGSLLVGRSFVGLFGLVFEEVAWIPVVGEALAVAAILVSIIDLDIETNKKVFLAFTRLLGRAQPAPDERKWFKRILDNDAELKRAYDRFTQQASDLFPPGVGLRRADESWAVLRNMLPAMADKDTFIDERMLESREHSALRLQPWNQGGLAP